MADFTNEFWNWWIIAGTVFAIVFCFILIWWLGGGTIETGKEAETMGHVWDEDLEELNNPLPKWWLNMFYITLVFSIGYLALYPGLGTFAGYLGWTAENQYEAEIADADAKYGPLFEKHAKTDLIALAEDEQAMKMGERLYASFCVVCHGSDARGARGFPNLRDNDWLWGGDAAAIEHSIMSGRTGAMPAWEAPLGGPEGVSNMVDYVLSLSGRKHDAAAAEKGKEKYAMLCVGCHGVDGKGNTMLGAANLTDKTWLYGASRKRVTETIAKGRTGIMPAHKDFLGEAKVHLLAAYVYSLSDDK